jgi:hypothetical protein
MAEGATSGVPNVRQLEPDWRMAEPTGRAATRSLSHRRGVRPRRPALIEPSQREACTL